MRERDVKATQAQTSEHGRTSLVPAFPLIIFLFALDRRSQCICFHVSFDCIEMLPITAPAAGEKTTHRNW